jgi:hypothetical protein
MNPVTVPTPGISFLGSNKWARSIETASCDEPKLKKQKANSVSRFSAPATPTLAKFPFTDVFFVDMAVFIRDTFRIGNFAERYHCNTKDVLDALSAVVLNPLCAPSNGLPVSDHAQILIADWREDITKVPNDLITISDNSPELHPVSSSQTPESPESEPLFDTYPLPVFTSPIKQIASPPSSPGLCNPSSGPAGKGPSGLKSSPPPAAIKPPRLSQTKSIARRNRHVRGRATRKRESTEKSRRARE